MGFYQATTEEELDEAGKALCRRTGQRGLTLIELLVTHKALKFASRKLAAKYPPPERLRERFAEGSGRHSRKGKHRASGEQTEAERRRAASEATPKERKALERLQDLRRTVEARGGMELGKDLSKNLPNPSAGHVVAIGVIGLAVTGLFALAAAASQEDEQPGKRRSRRRGARDERTQGDAALAALAVVGTVLTLGGFAVAVALSLRVAENRFHPATSATTRRRFPSPPLDFSDEDLEAAARMLASENEQGKSAALDRADWDSASCAKGR